MENKIENKWRFPASGHGERKGISSGDMETFKKSPVQAFAREIIQNSIDARASDEEPVIVEFHIFDMPTKDIPGCQELKDAFRRCKEFWPGKKDYSDEYEAMIETLNQETIQCLRVSDFNTTGLIGVDSTEQQGNNFLALTKGTGVSEKRSSMAGGSKGVGKNAAFLMSSIQTVFYSTYTDKDINNNKGKHEGTIGVAELVSGYLDDDKSQKDRDYTQGTGYYCCDELKTPLNKIVNLDQESSARTDRTGTDIFILGFQYYNSCFSELVNSILDSFMSTIYYGELEIAIGKYKINKETLNNIVFGPTIETGQKSSIISQFLLLEGKDVKVDEIETDYGNCQFYLLPFDREHDLLATHQCSMIRDPHMKIKDLPLGANFNASAMCIIPPGKLGEALRNIENPQHKDWETKRIKDPSLKREMDKILSSIKKQILQKTIDHLKTDDESPLDPNGAGDYLPDNDIGDNGGSEKQKTLDQITVSVPKENKAIMKNANQQDDNGNGLEPDIGAEDDEIDGEIQHPVGENSINSGDSHPGDESSGEKEGDNIVYVQNKLAGVRYRIISMNKNTGKIRLLFLAPCSQSSCFLCLSLIDDTNESTKISISKMLCNSIEITSKDKYEFGPFSIVNNQKTILEVETENKGLCAYGVKIICK